MWLVCRITYVLPHCGMVHGNFLSCVCVFTWFNKLFFWTNFWGQCSQLYWRSLWIFSCINKLLRFINLKKRKENALVSFTPAIIVQSDFSIHFSTVYALPLQILVFRFLSRSVLTSVLFQFIETGKFHATIDALLLNDLMNALVLFQQFGAAEFSGTGGTLMLIWRCHMPVYMTTERSNILQLFLALHAGVQWSFLVGVSVSAESKKIAKMWKNS